MFYLRNTRYMIPCSTQFLSFFLCGGLAALVNMGTRWMLNHFMDYNLAIVLAFFSGMLTAFLLFKFFVFHAGKSSRTAHETLWFILVNALALLQTLLISVGLADYVFPWLEYTWHASDIAHVIGVLVPVFTSFIGHKCFTFRKD